MTDGKERCRMAAKKPDIALGQEERRPGEPPLRTVRLIEIKYCRDAWPETQVERAREQYAELATALHTRDQRAQCTHGTNARKYTLSCWE